MSLQSIISEIAAYVDKHGGRYAEWYAGIAFDPRKRLFNDHNVNEKSDAWIYRDCGSETDARSVEEYFLKKGCDGNTGGGDRSTKYVYLYKENGHTNP